MEVVSNINHYKDSAVDDDVIESDDAPPPLYNGTLLEEKPWRRGSVRGNMNNNEFDITSVVKENDSGKSDHRSWRKNKVSPNRKEPALPETPNSSQAGLDLFIDGNDDDSSRDSEDDGIAPLPYVSRVLEQYDENSYPDKRSPNSAAETKNFFSNLSSSRPTMSRTRSMPAKAFKTRRDEPKKSVKTPDSSSKTRRRGKNGNSEEQKSSIALPNENLEKISDILAIPALSSDKDGGKTESTIAALQSSNALVSEDGFKKKKKRRKRSTKDEILFKEMAQRICSLGTLIVRQQKRKQKLENALQASVQDVLYLGRRFEDFRRVNGGSVYHDNSSDGNTNHSGNKDIELDEIPQKNEELESNDGNGRKVAKTELELNIELREIKAKLRMEQQDCLAAKEQISQLHEKYTYSQTKAEDLEQELNFHSAKAGELQALLSKSVETGVETEFNANTMETVELRSRQRQLEDEVKKYRKEIELLTLDKESKSTMVAELSNIIDPKGLWDDDLKNVMNDMKDGAELEKDKAQELTIKHLTSRVEQCEDDKGQYVDKIVALKEQMANLRVQLESENSPSSQQMSSKIINRFRRSTPNALQEVTGIDGNSTLPPMNMSQNLRVQTDNMGTAPPTRPGLLGKLRRHSTMALNKARLPSGSAHGSLRGSKHGSSHGSKHGPSHGSMHGPTNGSMHGSTNGSMHGSTNGSMHGSTNGSMHGPTNGSMHGSTNGSMHGPKNGPTHSPVSQAFQSTSPQSISEAYDGIKPSESEDSNRQSDWCVMVE